MARKLLIPLSAAVVGALIAAAPAAAATVTDCEDLQPALNEETTVTLVEGLTCTGSWSLPSREIMLEGAGSGATLRGDGESRILEGADVGRTTIRNLIFTRGDGDSNGGGAIFVSGDSPIAIASSTFIDNDADGPGGAVSVNAFGQIGNQQDRGAAGAVPSVSVSDSTFGDEDGGENTSRSTGGALAVEGFPLDVDGSAFTGNVAEQGGGGLSSFAFGAVTLTGNSFTGNVAGRQGGGALISYCADSSADGNTFDRNTVFPDTNTKSRQAASEISGHAEGGGLWAAQNFCFTELASAEGDRGALGVRAFTTLTQSGNAFRANVLDVGPEGSGRGAGEHVENSQLHSTSDVFHANEVVGSGAFGSGGALSIDAWGGQPAYGANLVATANTIPGGDGGAINYATDTFQGGSLELLHATVAANDSGDGGAINGGPADDLVLSNSIVHGNAGSEQISGVAPFDEGEPGTLGSEDPGTRTVSFSLLCDGTDAFAGEGNLCADPKLVDPAAGDVHQTAASPTLERASATLTGELAEDYEGDARKLDYDRSATAEPDMGADEAPAPAPATTGGGQTLQPAPAASGGVLGTQAKRCTSRRSFKIKLRNRGQKVVKATVIVNGKRVKVLRGGRLTSRIDLRGLPKGRFSVRIKLRLANGKTLSGVRRYYTCRPGRPSGPPPV